MHFLIVTSSIPNPGNGGGGSRGFSLIKYLTHAGYKVTVVAVVGKVDHILAINSQKNSVHELFGANIITVPYTNQSSPTHGLKIIAQKLYQPTPANLWPQDYTFGLEVVKVIAKVQPDCVIALAFNSVLYTHELESIPRIGFQSEAPHINTYVNWRYCPPFSSYLSPDYIFFSLKMGLGSLLQEQAYIKLCKKLTLPVFNAPHYVSWAKSHNIERAVYAPTSMPDSVGLKWRELRDKHQHPSKCKILMIGHLYSTSNRSGLPLFFFEVLPTLEKDFGVKNFEVHFVGRHDLMPERFNIWRQHPALFFRGPIYPADEEFLSADILLVTVPAPTGPRTRIINGFSFGCCIVAHAANALGIPELKHEENILLASSGPDLAHQVIRAAQDPELRQTLGANGRKVYEQFYTESVAGQRQLELIESVMLNPRS